MSTIHTIPYNFDKYITLYHSRFVYRKVLDDEHHEPNAERERGNNREIYRGKFLYINNKQTQIIYVSCNESHTVLLNRSSL